MLDEKPTGKAQPTFSKAEDAALVATLADVAPLLGVVLAPDVRPSPINGDATVCNTTSEGSRHVAVGLPCRAKLGSHANVLLLCGIASCLLFT